jgi:pyruvate ferredoxin oxidoreductase gamma subunit
MFRIRFHGRGGQGIKTSSRILGTAFFREGFEVQDAPVYGAERRGAPMFAAVRAARVPIQERGLVTRPDLVIVADESLITAPTVNVLLGLSAHTVMLINSAESAVLWKERLKLAGPVVTLPASEEVKERAELPYAGAMCAGAGARLTGAIRRESLIEAVRAELGEHDENVVARNIEHALAAFDALAAHAGLVSEGAEITARGYARPDWIDLPFETARVAAPDIHAAATSVLTKTGVWRTVRPVIDYALCHRCVWVCSTLCPDSAIGVDAQGAPQIDYDHCKGCLVCVSVCPPHAIHVISEHEAQTAAAGGTA